MHPMTTPADGHADRILAAARPNGELVSQLLDELSATDLLSEAGDGWLRLRFLSPDELGRLGVDVLVDTTAEPDSIAFLLPSGGLNFAANYFVPRQRNLAHHLREHSRLVISVSPREDLAEPADITAEWGQAAHKRDARRVIDRASGVLGLPYELIGHSSGATLALDIAASDDSPLLRRVVALEQAGPYTGDRAERALVMRDVVAAKVQDGPPAADIGMKGLIGRALQDPDGPTPVPHPHHPQRTFTHAELAHFALLQTSKMPGLTNWLYAQGFSAGSYRFGSADGPDEWGFSHMSLELWGEVAAAYGSGLVPVALQRDLSAAFAGDDSSYPLGWEDIRAEVVVINGALGLAGDDSSLDRIRKGGNDRVSFHLVPGYGHGDVIWGVRADRDVWPLVTGGAQPDVEGSR